MSSPAPTYVVTTSVGGKDGSSLTLVWNSSQPLTLGHPLKWILERTESGVRVREIPQALQVVQKPNQHEFTHEMLAGGAEVALDRTSFKLKSARELVPVFSGKSGDRLSVFCCAGSWVLDARPLGEHYRAFSGKRPFFSLKQDSGTGGYRLESLEKKDPTLEVSIGGEPRRPLGAGQSIALSADQIRVAEIFSGMRLWRFASARATEFTPAIPDRLTARDEETLWFGKALKGSALALAAFVAVAWLWPKPKLDQELIPSQYAQIIMTKPEQATSAPSSASAGPTQPENADHQKVLPKKVQEAAVVQAFRAKALQNAVTGLLKGGMSQLLVQSDFVAGKEASKDARRIFDSKIDALRPTGLDTGLTANKNVKIASIGGGGDGTGAKGAVGYAKGEHAAVLGQGHSFVAMDIPGASVDEGLTKDEVGEVIHRHLSEVRYCYESAMLRQPDIEGKLVVDFTIGGPGTVKSSEVKSSSLPDPRLDDCILRRLVTWKFPQTKGGIEVAVSYPFIFKTLGR